MREIERSARGKTKNVRLCRRRVDVIGHILPDLRVVLRSGRGVCVSIRRGVRFLHGGRYGHGG